MSLVDTIKAISHNNSVISANNEKIAQNEESVYHAGYGKGYSNGETEGYNKGKTDGYADGYADGVSAGGDTTTAYNEGFTAGKQAEYDALWDSIQDYGNRTDYRFAFAGEMWSPETFKPKYPIRPTTCTNGFAYWGQYGAMAELIDLRGLPIDFSKATDLSNCFYRNNQISAVGVIDTRSADSASAIFNAAYNLETVEKFIVKDDGSTTLTNAFTNCRKLTNITFEGVLGSNGLHFGSTPYLTHDSIMNIINHLKIFRLDITRDIAVNTGNDIEGTYTISAVNGITLDTGLTVYTATLSEADFTVEFYMPNNNIKNMLVEGNKIYIKFFTASGVETATLYDKDYATAHTCTFGTTNLNKLSNEEKAIATEKGWTLA